MENLKTPLERHRRRIAVLRSDGGFPSIVNLRAEEIPADHLIEQDLRIDIENLSEWYRLHIFGSMKTSLPKIIHMFIFWHFFLDSNGLYLM